MTVDLHLHTTASDGSLSPEAVVERAASAGLSVISVSDHDTVAGIDKALEAGARYGIRVIPAVELSSKLDSRVIHILGYFISHRDKALTDYLKVLRDARHERNMRMVACLQTYDIDISLEEVVAEAEGSAPGRPHIARVLLAKGYVETFADAFKLYLRQGLPCYIEKFTYEPEHLIRIIHEAGGIAVLAHPGIANIDNRIPELLGLGLDGLEVYHTEHSAEDTARYLELAKQHDLPITGGSDCHGPVSSHGFQLGSLKIPESIVDELDDYIISRRQL